MHFNFYEYFTSYSRKTEKMSRIAYIASSGGLLGQLCTYIKYTLCTVIDKSFLISISFLLLWFIFEWIIPWNIILYLVILNRTHKARGFDVLLI